MSDQPWKITIADIEAWERGEWLPDRDTLCAIAELLDLRVEELLTVERGYVLTWDEYEALRTND